MSNGTGPDDLIARDGPVSLAQVIAAATPADPVVYLKARLSSAPDPRRALRECLDDKAFLVAVQQRGLACQADIETLCRTHGAKGHFDKAIRAAERDLRALDVSSRAEQTTSLTYSVIDGRLHVQQGDHAQPLANFDARIVSERIVDDGAEQSRWFEVEGTLSDGRELPRISVEPTAFLSEPWWTIRWGASAIAEPGRLSHEHLRVAIQTLSKPATHITFSHTGWREVEGRWVFLHGGGAIGAEGVDVRLEGAHARYVLPAEHEDPRVSLRVVLKFLGLASSEVAYSLLLAPFRAPLCEVLSVDGTIFVHGPTGSLKSSVAKLGPSHFGQGSSYDPLAASFNDTLASLESTLHRLKDTVVVVDEFVPRSADANDDTRKKAISLLRSIGNGAPRNRMRSDLSTRPSRPPRGLVMMTGEQVPDGESIVARTWLVAFRRDTIDRSVLSELQAEQAHLAHAMAGYLTYLAPRLDVLRDWVPKRHRELQHLFEVQGDHLRASSMAAHLALAADTFAEYAQHIGVFNADQAKRFLEDAHAALKKNMRAQFAETQQENPARQFLRLLGDLVSRNQVRLLGRTEEMPTNGSWPEAIGWRDQGKWLLLPDVSYAVVADFAKRQGQPLVLPQKAMWRALRDLGVLAQHGAEHHTVQRMLCGRRQRVLELREDALEEPESGDVPPAEDQPKPFSRRSSR